jgi:UPF0271 protein
MVDLNCDLGEGIGNEEAIMPYINSANIACGYHAGDVSTMQATIRLCLQQQVNVGAHPSFLDRENFGRTSMNIPPRDIYELVTQQLIIINEVAITEGATLRHVKPHGALYNMSAADESIAKAIARAVFDFDPSLLLYGLSGSKSIDAASSIGLRTAHEAFADRTYQDDGTLTARNLPGAVLADVEQVREQVRMMVHERAVLSINNKRVPMAADSICIHGDGPHAVVFARSLHQMLGAMS